MRYWFKYLMQVFKNQELAKKLIWIYCVLILVPMFAIGIYAYASFQTTMQQNVGSYQLQALKQVSANIDTYMKELDRLTLTTYSYKEVMDFISSEREPGKPLSLQEIGSLNRFVSSIFINGRIDILGVSLYGEKGASYVVLPESQYITTYRLDESADWLKKIKSREGQPFFITTHEIRSTTGMGYQAFSVARELKNFNTGKTLGYIVIDVDPVNITRMLEQSQTNNSELMYLVDGEGKVVISRDDLEPSIHLGPLSGQNVIQSYDDGSQKQLIAYVTSDVTGWTIISAVPIKILMKDMLTVRNSIAIVMFICIFLAILVSVIIAYRITLPLRKLSRLMRKVEQGEIFVQFPVTTRDEVGRLGESFNRMLSKLSELGYLLYETEIREKDAQIAALQFQINPHFLYNTLGSISMLAEMSNNQEIITMSNNLSKILRYSLSNRKDQVTVRDELVHVNGYMSIQQLRYEDRIRYSEFIEEDAYQVAVIPLSIQPLLENAINHGIDKGIGQGQIHLNVTVNQNTLTITVEDDGIGISNAELEKLRERLEHSRELGGQSGNGLLNVHRRIKLNFGEPYGLKIESRPYQGFKVILTLPAIRKLD